MSRLERGLKIDSEEVERGSDGMLCFMLCTKESAGMGNEEESFG